MSARNFRRGCRRSRMFPGKQFISTVLDILDTKNEMTGQIAKRYLMRAAMAGIIIGVFYTTYYTVGAGFDPIINLEKKRILSAVSALV